MSKESIHKTRLVKLKKLGVLPNIDARKKIDEKIKRQIRDQWKKYGTVASAAPGTIQKISTKNLTATQVWELQRSGYTTNKLKKSVYIPKHGNDIVKLKNINMSGEKHLVVSRRKIGGTEKNEFVISDRAKMMDYRERLMHDYLAGKFNPNEFIGLQLFENNHFARIFTSMKDIYKYTEEEIQLNTEHVPKEYLLNNLKLVQFRTTNPRDISADEMTTREKNRKKRIQRRNRQGTYIKRAQTNKSGNVKSGKKK